MRQVENYEIVLSEDDNKEEKLLLTFSSEDLPHIPQNVTMTSYDYNSHSFKVEFEDSDRWEEVLFPALPLSLEEMLPSFSTILIVSLSDKVEMFSESPLEHINLN